MDENNKYNSPNGWTDEELNGRLENNSPNRWTDGELNDQHENNSPRVGQHKNNSLKG